MLMKGQKIAFKEAIYAPFKIILSNAGIVDNENAYV